MSITVLTTPTKIIDSEAQDHLWQVRNNGTGTITLGRNSSTLTAVNGFTVASGSVQQVDVKLGEQLFAVTATTATVDVI